jgi:hypothetical protein
VRVSDLHALDTSRTTDRGLGSEHPLIKKKPVLPPSQGTVLYRIEPSEGSVGVSKQFFLFRTHQSTPLTPLTFHKREKMRKHCLKAFREVAVAP